MDDGLIHTKEIQNAIDDAAKTGGVVVVPAGVYYTGAIYFKQGVNLYLSQGATLKGSDNITDYDLNIIVRRIQVDRASNLLWLKMRPDTPQHYEYIRMEDITGEIDSFININPWTQFYDLKDRKDIPLSYADHVTMQNCNCTCRTSFNVKPAADQYRLSDFVFENLEIRAQEADFAPEVIENAVVTNCNVTQVEAAPEITDIPDVPGKKLS